MRSALIATVAVVLLAGCGQSAETAKSEAAAAPALAAAVAIDPSFTGFAKPGDTGFGLHCRPCNRPSHDERIFRSTMLKSMTKG